MTKRPDPLRFTAEGFIEWAMEQPSGRYELVAGEVVAMAPERLGHARTKARALRALGDAVAAAGLPCEALPDGVSVRIDETTVYEPDALVRCGPPLPDDQVVVHDPIVVVEVISPSTRSVDAGAKLAGYFALPSVRHYLLLDTRSRTVTHHRRDEAGAIATRIREGRLDLDPPGRALDLASLFPAA
jgi:Uma2 family endonuclease